MNDDGGSAFPVYGEVECIGMSLRDWFAGQALAGVMGLTAIDGSSMGTLNLFARVAYKLADEMLEVRAGERNREHEQTEGGTA